MLENNRRESLLTAFVVLAVLAACGKEVPKLPPPPHEEPKNKPNFDMGTESR